EAREWYHREFDNKNWELENVLDNSGIGTTIAHIRGDNAGGITGAVAFFPNVPLGLTEIWQSTRLYSSTEKTHFLSGVRSDIRDEIYRISQTKPINDIIDSLAELELHYEILQQAPSQPRHAPIASAIPDVIPQQPAFPMADMQKMIQDTFAKQRAESKAEIEKLKAKLQAQQPQVAIVGNFQPPPKFYPIKSEKPQQAFYIVDQEGNNMDSLIQNSDYLKYLEQAKAESLEYMQCRIEDIIIPDGHNSDHIMKLEGGHKDVPISIKYKNKWVTETEHIVVINDGKPDYFLCLETPWIQK
ncbi:6118_t:CDS:2, partial [Dentiscutata erythropus]